LASPTRPGEPLIGIRGRKPQGPDPSAPPEISAIVPVPSASSFPSDRIGRLLRMLQESGDPFEILVVTERGDRDRSGEAIPRSHGANGMDAGPKSPETPRATAPDPRVRTLVVDSSGLAGALRAAAPVARAELLLIVTPDMPFDASLVRALREAIDPMGAFSYLPGSAAADLAVPVKPGGGLTGLVRRLVLGRRLVGPRSAFLCRRGLIDQVGLPGTDRTFARKLAADARRAGRVVRLIGYS